MKKKAERRGKMILDASELEVIREKSGWQARLGVIYIASSLSLER